MTEDLSPRAALILSLSAALGILAGHYAGPATGITTGLAALGVLWVVIGRR